ncbi:hypothetical protein FFWV33_18190 [Flavobacterium faecale]|uniref:Heat-shock protein Hsp90 n=1 Tax=Flavobacterium faecale TaxID=1355330 RepID=A0A2S1LI60_9FLAO|nr:hypothetical protein [Flavobacterium faecale]AWG23321.1 hypothetical protein FFWV33_18190 [Flavobacterium faecale]
MNLLKKTSLSVIALSFAVLGCKSPEKEETFVQKAEKAHQKEAFNNQEALQFDIKLEFGGAERMNGTMTLLTNSSKGMIELKNGSKIIYDKDKVFYSPDVPSEKSVRFDAYTWAYFFMFPYKMSDGGTIWSPYDNKATNKEQFETQKLNFESGTGDAPDDWYVVYTNKETHLVEQLAYIVTLKSKKEDAEKEPHGIKYKNFVPVDGVPFATEWEFCSWNEKDEFGQTIGKASLSNIKFITVTESTFTPGTDFKSI